MMFTVVGFDPIWQALNQLSNTPTRVMAGQWREGLWRLKITLRAVVG